jgi:glycosyltransferase involved in cell wall biosynthesis
MPKNNLAVCILALDEAAHIEGCLQSVQGLAQEIIVTIDSQTTDNTKQLASRFTKKIFVKPHQDQFHKLKQWTLEQATQPWVLWLDADEIVTPKLAREIKETLSHPRADGYWIPRKNLMFGKWIRHANWYPDHQLRLFKKGSLKFPAQRIHENPVLTGQADFLKQHLVHYNYHSVSQFIDKLNRYTSIDAAYYQRELKPPYSRLFITRPIQEFINRFLAQKGYRDGLHGLALSLLQGAYELVVVIKVWELNRYPQAGVTIDKTETVAREILKHWNWWKRQLKIDQSPSVSGKFWQKLLRKLEL